MSLSKAASRRRRQDDLLESADGPLEAEPPGLNDAPRIALVVLAALVAGVALWKFAGFHRLPAWEGWVVYGGFARGAQGWWVTPSNGGVAGNSLRPLEVLPHQIGYLLAFGSFVAFNLVSMAAFVVRAGTAYIVTRELLPGSRAVAFATAFIFALSPAADGAMLDRAIHVQWSGALMMGSFASILVAVRRRSTPLAGVSALLVAAAVLMYEAVLPAAVLVPLFVLFATPLGCRRFGLRLLSVYATGLAGSIGYLLWSRTRAVATTYQDTIATTRRPIFDHEGLTAVAQAFKWEVGGFLRHAIANDLPMRRPSVTLGAVVLTAMIGSLAALVMWFLRTGDQRVPTTLRRSMLVATLGVTWMVLSLAVFLPFMPYRYETLRVHSLSQFGPILLFGLVAKLLYDRRRAAGAALVLTGVIAASFIAVQNARLWEHWSDFQSQIISAVAVQAADAPQRTIVIREETDRLSHIYEFGPSGLFLGRAYDIVTGGDQRTMVVCNQSGISAVGPVEMGACTWTDTELVIQPRPGTVGPVYRAPRNSLLDLTLHAGDQPQLRPTDGTPPRTGVLSSGVRGWLTCIIGQACSRSAVEWDLPTPPFTEGFDRRYSYEDVPVRGMPVEGFGPLQSGGGSWRWTMSPDAAVFARVGPGRYRIRFRVLRSIEPRLFDNAMLTFNAEPLSTQRVADGRGGGMLTAEVTVSAGGPTADRIGVLADVVSLPQAAGTSLGLAIASVIVQPI